MIKLFLGGGKSEKKGEAAPLGGVWNNLVWWKWKVFLPWQEV